MELAKLVSIRLKPVKRPIKEKTSLGPYLSNAQPPAKVKNIHKIMNNEEMLEVAARVKSNSLVIDLKKTPNDSREPARTIDIKTRIKTMTQP